jgi:hypothetical protein
MWLNTRDHRVLHHAGRRRKSIASGGYALPQASRHAAS